MTCGAIMTRNPISVREDETIGRAAKQILDHRYINLPVVDAEGRMVGLFGIYDLLGLLVPRVAVIGNLLPNLRFMSDDANDFIRRLGFHQCTNIDEHAATIGDEGVKAAITQQYDIDSTFADAPTCLSFSWIEGGDSAIAEV